MSAAFVVIAVLCVVGGALCYVAAPNNRCVQTAVLVQLLVILANAAV